MIFSRFGLPFWHHFGLRNRSQGPSGAKRSTLDFERRYYENQVFSPWSVPGDTQNHSQKPYREFMFFSKDFQPKKYIKMAPKQTQNCKKNALKFRLVFVQFFFHCRVPAARSIRGSAGGCLTLWHLCKTSKIKKIIDFVWEGCKFGNIAFWYPSKKLF